MDVKGVHSRERSWFAQSSGTGPGPERGCRSCRRIRVWTVKAKATHVCRADMAEYVGAEDLSDVVGEAGAGEELAWSRLVRMFDPLMWAVVHHFRLGHADSSDVVQDTWIALVENLVRVRDPRGIPGWLSTATRRNALRRLDARKREAPLTAIPGDRLHAAGDDPVDRVLSAERDELLWHVIRGLPERDQLLLTLIAHHPELSYAELAQSLGVSEHTIPSLRARCFARLRHRLRARGITGS
ncbi:MAG: sigma-70 family RNA polymerase sigma factor [Pseudonocardiaceae bacterium]|nr:sigma-70 family RNA polymerase sigma factor [Pseudonocardiaceae bacterium]